MNKVHENEKLIQTTLMQCYKLLDFLCYLYEIQDAVKESFEAVYKETPASQEEKSEMIQNG